MKTHVERELKLAAGPRYRLPELPGKRLAPRILTSVYFDTSTHRLASAGVTLRRRVEGGRSRWQLKLPRGQSRLEVEVARAPAKRGERGRGVRRTGSDVPPARLIDLVTAYGRGAALLPVATLRTRREGVRVRDLRRPIAEVVLDSVQVLDGQRAVTRFREIEVELTGGDEAGLARIEQTLRAGGATDGDGRPKLLRALGIQPAPPPAPLPPSAPASEHLRAMIETQLGLIVAYDPGTRLGQEPEALHQMRVATRRLRALLREAGPMLEPEWVDPLRTELAWLGDELGPMRDLDVFRQHLAGEIAMLDPADRPSGARLIRALDAERHRARVRLLGALRSDRYLRLLGALDEAASHPRTIDAAASLESVGRAAFRRLRRAVRGLDNEPTEAALHKVRIKVKRARYAAELAAPVVGDPAKRFIGRAKDVQDVLGDYQDGVMVQQRLRALAAAVGDAGAALVAGRLLERQIARGAKSLRRFPKRWRKLEKRGRKTWR